MIKYLFPYTLHLQILQLYEYTINDLLRWTQHHYFTRSTENKKPIVWTPKARFIYILAIILALSSALIFTVSLGVTGFLLGLIIATQAYIFLVISRLILLPWEKYQKNKIKTETENKILKQRGLKVIGITGSYGKTSVKEFLYQILKCKYNVLKTPESFNTPYGIAKVVDLELDDSYDYFICEMGAYRVGEIKEICDMVHPQYGILTGINEQHLSTFKSIQNTISGKFELFKSIPSQGFGIYNRDNALIVNNVGQCSTKLYDYGYSSNNYSVTNIHQSHNGSEFDLILKGKSYRASTKLFGRSNIQNILAAAAMSHLLGVNPNQIVQMIGTLAYIPHRLQLIRRKDILLIDDAYNSNVDGFKEAIHLLKTFGKNTVFVTPGIVDLGTNSEAIHKELGEYTNGIDYVILVGKSQMTSGLKKGIPEATKIIEIDSIKEVWSCIRNLNITNPIVLLENDLPDNYL
ncbi:UDP-N-acetylmuramoyl-tripeptide--D-alanyl-D-alanine ligase [Candidatus Roizmanbacteria bacterium]|nr:UDP-N-acetylmuramoyl-tripeptide--D-alanyl-D-alanine ligase [Candidatus Roizmanbacteria bacterium]